MQDYQREVPHRQGDTPAKLSIEHYFMRRRITAKGLPPKSKRQQRLVGLHGNLAIKQGRVAKFKVRLKRAIGICGKHDFGTIFRCGILPQVA
jgi:hypothetical protein